MSTSQLERRKAARMSAVAWEADTSLSFADWQDAGRRLGLLGRASRWWIGDWINFGASAYGEKYEEALGVTGYSVGDLMDMAWVASTFEITDRSEILSWSHHRAVAALEPDERREWLARAEAEGWPRKRLQAALKQGRTLPRPERVVDGGARQIPQRAGEKPRLAPETATPSTAVETLLLELSHPGERDEVDTALGELCGQAERLGFAVLERPTI